MKSRTIWLIFSCLMVLVLVLASCGTKTTSTTTTASATSPTTKSTVTQTSTQPVTTPTSVAPTSTGPQYGGVFLYSSISDVISFDPYNGRPGLNAGGPQRFYLEKLAMPDVTVDRNVWDFKTLFIPIKYMKGQLAESWETPDMATYIFHIRKGVTWHDKAPVNGRELTADDIEYSFHRQLGMAPFTQSSPYMGMANYALIESVTATDKNTVVFKTSVPSLTQFSFLITDLVDFFMVPKEAIDLYGSLDNWKNAQGTGPWMLQDYVSGSQVTFTKNPNYWAYDELNSQNRLPYLDQVKVLIIPDTATSLAALRTGKIDMIEDLDWEQAANLKKANPELLQVSRPYNGFGIYGIVDQKPYSDIRVRQALQKSIDLKTIAATYYGGNVEGVPVPLICLNEYHVPFNEWPKEVQDGYAYDPEAAKKLLADAGYPSGFKITITVSTSNPIDLVQIIKSYFEEIGVDMTIQTMDPGSYQAYTRASKHELCSGVSAISTWPPINSLNRYLTGYRTYLHHVNDATFDELYDKAKSSLNEDEQKEFFKEADMYAVKEQWAIAILPDTRICPYQPWLKGFNGEITNMLGMLSARFWIDKELKKSMGH